MSYEVFQSKVNALIKKCGKGLSVAFSTDTEIGKHFAKVSDGTEIVGNSGNLKVTVKWGSGHTAMASI